MKTRRRAQRVTMIDHVSDDIVRRGSERPHRRLMVWQKAIELVKHVSLSELDTRVEISADPGCIQPSEKTAAQGRMDQLTAMLNGLIASRRS